MATLTKTAGRAIVKTAEAVIGSTMRYIVAETETFQQRIGRFEVIVAMALDEGADAYAEASLGDWREWGRSVLPGKTPPTIYRWRNAGKVARILRGPATVAEDGTVTYQENLLGEVPAALIGSLVPLYRILTSAKTDEDRTAAEGLIRETYRDVLAKCETFTETIDGETVVSTVPPTMETVLAAAEAASPATKGTKGKTKTNEQPKTADEGETPAADGGESRRESSSGLVVADAAAVEAAAAPTGAIMAGLSREHSLPAETVLSIALATLRLASEWGVSTVQAVLTAGTPAADAAAAETPAETK
jgi:hypothetical protein